MTDERYRKQLELRDATRAYNQSIRAYKACEEIYGIWHDIPEKLRNILQEEQGRARSRKIAASKAYDALGKEG